MKETRLIITLIASAFILSGCIISTSKQAADGGIFRSVDSGETWEQKVFIAQLKKTVQTIASFDTEYLTFDPLNSQTLILITKSSGIYKTENSGDRWQPTTLTSGQYSTIAIDPKDTHIVYVGKGNTILKSADGMATWQTSYVEVRPNETITSIAIDSFDTSRVYATTNTSVLKSLDYGNTWQALDWKGKGAQKLYISNRDTRIIYLLTSQQGLYKSIDGAISWEKINWDTKSYPGSLNINWVAFYPETELIYLATNYGIIKSEDRGGSWRAVETILPFKSLPIQTVAVNPKNTNEIFFTVKNVLYKSVDGGQTWKTLRTVPTNRVINTLLLDPVDPSIMYVGTMTVKTK